MIDLFIEKKNSKKGGEYVYLYALTDYGRKIPLSFDMSVIVELLDMTPRKLMALSIDLPLNVGSIYCGDIDK